MANVIAPNAGAGALALTSLTGNELLPVLAGSTQAVASASLLAALAGTASLPATAAITAGTTRTQGGATALATGLNRVDTSTAPAAGSTLGDGVILPVAAAGKIVYLINNTANLIQLYGNGTDTINGVAAATGIPVPAGDVEIVTASAAGSWQMDAGVGSSSQFPVELANDNISAAGSTQGTATALTAVMNKVTTATAGSAFGIRLPTSASGLDIFVENHSGTALQVYGASTDQIDDVATATGVVQMDSSVVIYTCYTAGKWYSNGLATGYAKNPQSGTVLETMQYADNLTAAGASQATGLQLLAAINTIATVAAGTGVNLPASAPGLQVTVINTGANPLLVYPAQGASDTINGIAAATGVSLFQGTAAQFNCTASGAWTTQPASTHQSAFNTASNTASFTATAANVTGGECDVFLALTGTLAGAANITTPTAAQMVAALHSPTVGTSYTLRIINESSGAFAWTVVAGASVTLTGTATIAQNTWRDFAVTVTNAATPAVTLQNVGTGTFS